MFSEPLSQYEEILKDAIRTSMKESGAKLAKTFHTLLSEILTLYSRPLKTIFQHKVCTDKLYADSFYKAQKSSHSSFEVICYRS